MPCADFKIICLCKAVCTDASCNLQFPPQPDFPHEFFTAHPDLLSIHHFNRLCSAVLIDGDKLTGTTSSNFEILNINAWVKSVLKTFSEDGTELVDLRMHT